MYTKDSKARIDQSFTAEQMQSYGAGISTTTPGPSGNQSLDNMTLAKTS